MRAFQLSLSKELVAERELNLSMAPSGGACELVTDVACVNAQDGRHLMEKPSDCILAADPFLQSDCQLDNTPIDDNVDLFDKTESSPDCRQEKEPAEDNLEAIDGTSHKGNSSGPETNYENLDLVQKKGSPSALAIDQYLIKTVNEDSIVDDANAATIRDIDACVEDINTTREDPGSPELGLNKQSAEDATEIAYGGDFEFDGYDDEYELVSDTEKELLNRLKMSIKLKKENTEKQGFTVGLEKIQGKNWKMNTLIIVRHNEGCFVANMGSSDIFMCFIVLLQCGSSADAFRP
jgi:hypothetical protein